MERVSFLPRVFTTVKQKAEASLLTDHYVLKDVSFDVCRGERVALVGPSGAGKTSLLRLFNRLSEPTKGVLYLNNVPLTAMPTSQLRQQVMLVLQESKLLGMTVQQALEYPLLLRRLPSPVIQARLQKWSDRLHLPSDWLHRTELQLSVGQRQIVAIARALITEPSVLLLDEPTSALDVGRGNLILTVLHELAEVEGMTVLMINHQLDLAAQFCSRLLYLNAGVLQRDLPADQVDWQALRQELVRSEAQQADDWG